MTKVNSNESLGESSDGTESLIELYSPTIAGAHATTSNLKYDNQIVYLTNENKRLTERMQKVENRLYSGIVEQLTKSGGCIGARNSMPELMVDTELITCRPRNQGLVDDLRNCARVLHANKFATCQCCLMLLVFIAGVVFGVMQIMEVDQTMSPQYKPFKVQGKDEYFRNEELEYTLPKFYYTFHMYISIPQFFEAYNERFNTTCVSSLDSCLYDYMEDFLNGTNDVVHFEQCNMI